MGILIEYNSLFVVIICYLSAIVGVGLSDADGVVRCKLQCYFIVRVA